ncbi:MAG: hypothetical protein WBN65_01205 [Gammaproteobacteria bacterium]
MPDAEAHRAGQILNAVLLLAALMAAGPTAVATLTDGMREHQRVSDQMLRFRLHATPQPGRQSAGP